MEAKILKVRLLGDFALEYGGRPVILERSSRTKATQMLQYFLCHMGEKTPRGKLLELFYAGEEVANPSNNLKVNISRLRRLLAGQLEPHEEYIYFGGGKYYWSSFFPVELDTQVFERLAREAQNPACSDERRMQYITEAMGVYKGRFLPMLPSEDWVVVEDTRLREIYFSLLELLCALQRKLPPQAGAEEICRRAVEIYPYEERAHAARISSLMTAGKLREALMAYHDMAGLFFEEMGAAPSPEMEAVYRRLCEQMEEEPLSVEDIKQSLRDDRQSAGAYYCNLLSFIDCYRVVTRIAQRTGQTVFLMLCTMTDTDGSILTGERLEEAAQTVRGAIRDAIRRGDAYTRYNQCRFLIMLTSISREDCMDISDRIWETFRRQTSMRGVRLQFGVVTADLPEMEDPCANFSPVDAGR